jgi:hypothetical protein
MGTSTLLKNVRAKVFGRSPHRHFGSLEFGMGWGSMPVYHGLSYHISGAKHLLHALQIQGFSRPITCCGIVPFGNIVVYANNVRTGVFVSGGGRVLRDLE